MMMNVGNRTHFSCWLGIRVHNSGHKSDLGKLTRFTAFVIVFYSAHDKTKTKQIVYKRFFLLAGNLGP